MKSVTLQINTPANVPGLVTLELALGLLLLFAQSRFFSFALLFEEEGGTTLCHLVLCLLIILQERAAIIALVFKVGHITSHT